MILRGKPNPQIHVRVGMELYTECYLPTVKAHIVLLKIVFMS